MLRDARGYDGVEKQNANPEGLAFCLYLVPAKGVEPSTFALQVRCSTN